MKTIVLFFLLASVPALPSLPCSRYVEQHRVKDKAVVPGATFLNAALQAAHEAQPASRVVQVSGFRLIQMLEYYPGQETSCAVERKEGRRGRVACTHGGQTHAKGAVEYSDEMPAPTFQFPEGKSFAPPTLYDQLGGLGLEYGPLFRRLENIFVTPEGQGFGTLEIHPDLRSATGALLHPTLLDSSLHLLAAILMQKPAGEVPLRAAVPVYFGTVSWDTHAAPSHHYRAFAKITKAAKGERTIGYELKITDPAGHPVVVIQDGVLGIIDPVDPLRN